MKPFDSNGMFISAAPGGGGALRRLAVRGAGMTVLSGVLSLAIQVIATVVLARLLTPRDFGLVTMVTTFSLLLSNFGINGITEAIVQREHLDHILASNLFWMNLAGGLLLTCGFAAAGSAIAKFFGEPLVAPIAAGIAISIVLTSPSVVHLALLKRAMHFPAVAKNDIVAKAASVAVSILFGWAGWGYWALVLGICAAALSSTIGAWSLCHWLPGRPRVANGTGSMMKFAMYTYGRFSVNYFARNSDNLLVGWRFGAPTLGFYKKAYDLFSLSAAQLVSATAIVAVSALSRVRNDGVQYRKYLLAALAMMAFVGMGISGDLTLVGNDVIRVLLGPGWGRAGHIFTFFAPGIGIMILYGTHGWIHLSIGRADRWFRWGIVEWVVTIVLFLISLHWGPEGIAVAWCVSFWVLTLPAMYYAGKPIGLGVGPVLQAVWRYIAASLIACVLTYLSLSREIVREHNGSTGEAALRVVLLSLGFAILYLSAIVALHRGLTPLRTLTGLLREMVSPAKPMNAPTADRNGSKTVTAALILVAILAFSPHTNAQTWSATLGAKGTIHWAGAGVGQIPPRLTNCATLTPSATVAQINSALATCPSDESVYLLPGTYLIDGTIHVPSDVTLRGAGADRTILNALGRGGGDVISLGSGGVPYRPLRITAGNGAGSTSISVSEPAAVRVGMYLAVAEVNDEKQVSSQGSGGHCNWCDGGWTKNGSLARGQIVEVTVVQGKSISISPALYTTYSNYPVAIPFEVSARRAGVENLQVYANNTGYAASFGMSACAYCWIKGVESNYADGDQVEIYWGYHDEVRDSYFSNAFLHQPGIYDSDIQVADKTSASLVENNIVERTHTAIMLEWGAAGNVVSYNYTTGEFDSSATNLDIGGIVFHGAHPQFNLLEGNVVTVIAEDPVWGTSSNTTAYRNWIVGTNRICNPMSGRGTVICRGTAGHYGFQSARAIDLSYLATEDNYVGNVVGSNQMQSLVGYNYALKQVDSIEYPVQRNYDAVAYSWSFGYGSTSDDGMGNGCGGGIAPCHRGGISATDVLHGNYDNADRSTHWAADTTHEIAASLYLSGKPNWWGAIPFPATGPDVNDGTGPGGHTYGNPAQMCYLHEMGGTDGGAGSPLSFNADKCYGNALKRN